MAEQHTLDRLFETISARRGADPESSYTAKLFARGKLQIAKKLGEEGVETALAAVAQDKQALAAESADLLYHLLVLWAACDLDPRDAYAALDARTQRSGIDEKKSRG
ncbi:MAG TPA: phosphoribosyl-ATP diphosphatase [Rhizomicrobium sp.]|jgi:phosphoribosyl-ATP pyrophosphohydrolase